MDGVLGVLATRAALAGVVGLGSKAVSVAKGAGGVGKQCILCKLFSCSVCWHRRQPLGGGSLVGVCFL